MSAADDLRSLCKGHPNAQIPWPHRALHEGAQSVDDLLAALRKIETICTESAADCRKRMGTRVGNVLATARAAIAKAS